MARRRKKNRPGIERRTPGNPKFELQIENVAFGGDGVAQAPDGKKVFVPGTLPGETALVEIIREKRGFSKGRMISLKESSPSRVNPRCPLARRPRGIGPVTAPTCPGCAYQHADRGSELELKRRQYAEFIRRAGYDAEAEAVPEAETDGREYGYRNKITLAVQTDGAETVLGYFLDDNNTVFDLPECPLAHPDINAKLAELKNTPGFTDTIRDGMTVTFRRTDKNGVVFWRNKTGGKIPDLTESTPLGDFVVPADGFFQVNPDGTAKLLEIIDKTVRDERPESVLDLYGGAGLFAVAAAKAGAGSVIGIEIDAKAAAAAKLNFQRLASGVDGVFAAGKAENFAKALPDGFSPEGSLVILDPPRTGVSLKLLKTLIGGGFRKILYISCAADTLGRDLNFFHRAGYELRQTIMVDMFPQTAHFETVNLLLE